MATAPFLCQDCGHNLGMNIDLVGRTVVGDEEDLVARLTQHVTLNPDIHPTFVLSD